MLPDDHPLTITRELITTTFTTTSSQKGAFVVSMVWGIKDLDRSEVGLWDPNELGELVWDDEFDISPVDNQQSLMDLCAELSDDHALVKDDDVKCWINDMDLFVREDSNGERELPLENQMEFYMYLKQFAFQTVEGQEYVRSQQLGFDKKSGKLIMMKI